MYNGDRLSYLIHSLIFEIDQYKAISRDNSFTGNVGFNMAVG